MKTYEDMNIFDKASLLEQMIHDPDLDFWLTVEDLEFTAANVEVSSGTLTLHGHSGYGTPADFRAKKLKEIMQFIDSSKDMLEMYKIINEIRTVHDNFYAFSFKNNSVQQIESVCLNGDTIQMNLCASCDK